MLALCALAAAIDGFDTQAIGFTGSLIADDLGFDRALLGWIFSAGLFGAVLGAFVFGPLADRFGRARMLIVTCFWVGGCTALTLAASDFESLLLIRFLTGVGLGGATPCFMGLGVEAIPQRLRAGAAAMLYATFPAGAVLGALASAPILETHGWRGVFVFGALLPLGAGVLLSIALPASSGPSSPEVRKIGVGALFAEGRAGLTLALWPLFMLAFSAIILLSLWLPPLMQQLGVSPARTGLLSACLNAGSVVMSLSVGFLIARFGIARVLYPGLVIGVCGWWATSQVFDDFALLALAVSATGAAIGGLTTGLIVIASTAYPAPVRATGIGWSIGCARIGQMAAPPVIGALLAAGLSIDLIVLACAIPLIIAAVPLWFVAASARTPGAGVRAHSASSRHAEGGGYQDQGSGS